VSIKSTNADAIKRAISAKIKSATHFFCIVGARTSKSGWVAWEIDKAKELKKRLAVVKAASNNTTSSGLLNAGRRGALPLTFDAIKQAFGGA